MKKYFSLILTICSLFTTLWGDEASSERKFHVCTVANYRHPNLIALERSAHKYGLKLNILGMGEEYTCNFDKLFKIRKFLKDIPDQDIILFVDAFDVLLAGTEKQFVERFLSFKSPVVFSAERKMFPRAVSQVLENEYPLSDTSFKYLNSGQYIGYAWYIKKMVNELISNQHSLPHPMEQKVLNSDQFSCHRYFLRHLTEVRLDRENVLFVSMFGVRFYEFKITKEPFTFKVKETKNTPIGIHCNGNSKRIHFDKIAKILLD